MSLAISVFCLASGNEPEHVKFLEKEFKAINVALKKKKYPAHEEPTKLPAKYKPRSMVNSFPNDCYRQLRRFYENACRFVRDPKQYPLKARRKPAEIEEAEDWIADTLEYDFDSNLLCHSQIDGYFLPLPEDGFLCGNGFAGNGMFGSSNGLLKELVFLAPHLKITLVENVLTDEEHAKVWAECHNAKNKYMSEITAWLTLFETATTSIQFNTAIVFH